MAREKASGAKHDKTEQTLSSEEKIARVLGLMFVKDIEQKPEQVVCLRSIGFGISEIASMLGITENNASVAAYRGRKKIGKKKRKD